MSEKKQLLFSLVTEDRSITIEAEDYGWSGIYFLQLTCRRGVTLHREIQHRSMAKMSLAVLCSVYQIAIRDWLHEGGCGDLIPAILAVAELSKTLDSGTEFMIDGVPLHPGETFLFRDEDGRAKVRRL